MASTDAAAVRPVPGRLQAIEHLRREGLSIAVLSVFVAALATHLPSLVVQDTWFTLVGGREVLHGGLPGADTLTYWTVGKQWIDQQWLGQVLSYGLFSAGGLRLLVLANAAVLVAAVALSMYGARRRGAGPRAVTLVVACVAALFLIVAEVRVQTLTYPLFVFVLLLLLDDARTPSRRVFLAIPALVLWANLHGSVVLGVTLVALRGALLACRRKEAAAARARGGLLMVGALLAVFATPYGFRVAGYYRETLFNPSFHYVTEWAAPALSLTTIPLYGFAAFALWLLGRYHARFSGFERLALLLLLAAAFWSIRNVVWLALGAVPLLAPVVEDLVRGFRPAPRRTNVLLGLSVGTVACLAVAVVLGRPASWYERSFPTRAGAVIARTAERNPGLRIYANERYADWLLFTRPELRGRVAYDIRFELLSAAQVTSIVRWRDQITDKWRTAANGARLLVLDLSTESKDEARLLAEPGVRRIYRDRRLSVLLRPRRSRG